MGLLSTLKSALGLNTPVVPRDPEPMGFSVEGLSRVRSLPEGEGLHVATQRAATGRLVTVEEGLSLGPAPEGYERITIGDRDLQRLRGLVLDYRGDAWHVQTHLELRARETPNPHGRLFLCNRWLASGSPQFFTKESEGLPDLAALALAIPGVQSILVRENTLTVERVEGTPWDQIDHGVDVALRSYFLSTGHRLTSEAVAKTGLLGDIMAVLEEKILPGIHRDGGDLEVVKLESHVLYVTLSGACRSCPASTATLKLGVERVLREAFPEQIHSVEQI